MVLTADEGKAPMVPEDPIIEAVRRMIMGGVPMIRKGGQAASGQVAPHLPAKVRPKREFRGKHPKKLRLHPDEPIDADVFGFDDKMKRCSDLEKSRDCALAKVRGLCVMLNGY